MPQAASSFRSRQHTSRQRWLFLCGNILSPQWATRQLNASNSLDCCTCPPFSPRWHQHRLKQKSALLPSQAHPQPSVVSRSDDIRVTGLRIAYSFRNSEMADVKCGKIVPFRRGIFMLGFNLFDMNHAPHETPPVSNALPALCRIWWRICPSKYVTSMSSSSCGTQVPNASDILLASKRRRRNCFGCTYD